MNKKKPFHVSRTCKRILSSGQVERGRLESYRDLPAYVLLGDSGAGKTTAFESEADASDGKYVTARNFITFEGKVGKPGSTLFIDALDEMRAGGATARMPIDEIRKHLRDIKSPFRLSCREADWLGESDSQALKDILPGSTELVILHLNPLTEEDIKAILSNKKVLNPEEFIRTARKHNLGELLYNPQVLNLLINAVGEENTWPVNRSEIYEMACRRLATEENPEHRRARSDEPVDHLLDAAGYLCAIQLLSGIAGFAQDKSKANEQYFELAELSAPEGLPLAATLETNLFQQDGEERRIPIHRSVAEYLGAKYLAKLVNSKDRPLPFERVLALMPDETGAVASDLRGLCAWLAVHCTNQERKILINRDPLGIITYGDVRIFAVEDKKLILNVFKSKAKNADWPDFYDSSFCALGTADMVPVFQEILSSPSRENVDQKLLTIGLSAVAHGEAMPSLIDSIEKIVRDPSYKPFIRANAIDALIQCGGENALPKLAEDIRDGILEDRDDEVVGALLDKLYPDVITSEEVWNYFHVPSSHIVNGYVRFLYDKLVGSQEKDLPILLNGLVQKRFDLEAAPFEYHTESLVGKLLVRGLEAYGDKVSVKQLYEWLGLGINKHGSTALARGGEAEAIANWFAEHPEQYQSIIEYNAYLCTKEDNFDYCMWQCYTGRLQKAPKPIGMAEWYLRKAKLESDKHLLLSQHYFREAVIIIRGDEELTNDKVRFIKTEIKGHPALLETLERILNPPVENWENESKLMRQEWKDKEEKERSERAADFRKHLVSIREGMAHPSIMYNLAQAYSHGFLNIHGVTSHERLQDLLNNDQELIDAAYTGFKFVVNRQDLPTVKEIIDLTIQGKMHFIRPACLISVNMLYKHDPESILKRNDDLLGRLLAFRFSEDLGEKEEREWVMALIAERPALVEQIFVDYVSAMIKANKEHIAPLSLMIYGAYSKLAPKVLAPLLQSFPLRVSEKFSKNVLNPLIKGAIEYLDKKIFEAIIEEKLGNPSMDDIQKVYWLACGFMIAPGKYTSKLLEHVATNQAYKQDLENFVQSHWKNKVPFGDLSEEAIGLLIELLAPECSPERPLGFGQLTTAMQTADLVNDLINELQHNPHKSTAELQRLAALASISHWHPILERALHTKQIVQSISSFRYLKVNEVCHTLENSLPANAADLSALTMSLLRDIAKNIHDGNTNDYKQYWSYGPEGKLENPKPENDCRDALLSDLNQRFKPYGVEGHREGNYVDDKRADIKVSFNGFNVPIEIKRDCHARLWHSIQEQLIKKYVREQGARGYGIYVVFWFGKNGIPPDPKGERKVQSAKELEDRLWQTLTEEESRYIQVLVIDCSLPLKKEGRT